ncbi:MAG TPA: diaminopimelate epimerase [Patescibacteria group bacterium]|nr:diaminopimelate epimerase [Patescibacteria group bacterium]
MNPDTVDFVKMHGAGNDFIMIDDLEERYDPDAGTIAALCAYHRGIGADGLILLRPGSHSQFRMRYYNSDGGEAAMCGNGARCAALFAYRKGIAHREMTFETGSGRVRAEVRGGMVAVDIEDVRGIRLHMNLEDTGVEAHFTVAGVPHAVILVDDARAYAPGRFLALARSVRNDTAFQPAGANVNLVTVHRSDRLHYRTYERGLERETLACGTGAVASAVIAAHLDLAGPPVECETSGGDVLEVVFDRIDDGATNCRLVGPAVVAFTGSFSTVDYAPR